MELRCMKCGFLSHNSWMTVVYDPKRPKGAPKKNYVIGYLCETCERS